MQPTSEAPEIAGLLAETRARLAHLRADELEALAARAEEMLAACNGLATSQGLHQMPELKSARSPQEKCGDPSTSTAGRPSLGMTPSLNVYVRQEHKLLGDLLAATDENLRVLRRTHGSAERGSPWAR